MRPRVCKLAQRHCGDPDPRKSAIPEALWTQQQPMSPRDMHGNQRRRGIARRESARGAVERICQRRGVRADRRTGCRQDTAFKTEAARQGGVYVTVRSFLTFNDKPEWHDAMLFLDGLDESRAGTEDGRTPLDSIRNKLDRLGCPPFRLSCRWADWLAANDKEALQDVSQDGTVTVIRLDPLSERNIKTILASNHDMETLTALSRRRGSAGSTGCWKTLRTSTCWPKSSREGIGRIPARRRSTKLVGCSLKRRTESIWRRTRRA